MVIASDLAWRKASYNEFGGHYVASKSPYGCHASLSLSRDVIIGLRIHMVLTLPVFYANGIVAGEHNKGLFYFVIANGFLKLFLVILYMSQTFYGLKGGSHSPP